jgi:hypothetical protein
METIKLPHHFWNIDGYSIGDGGLDFHGWALPWFGRPFNKHLRRRDGASIEITTTVDKGFAVHFPYWPNVPTAPFSARTWIGGDLDYIAIESIPASEEISSVEPLEQFSRWLFLPTTKDFPVPPAEVIAHIGESSPDYYLMSGCTLFSGFKLVFEHYTQRPLPTACRILDWGCGPGRVGLHLAKELARDHSATFYIGVDIDPISLAWAQRSVKGTFIQTGKVPPLPFSDGCFDFIFSYSVFTHLDTPVQKRWLAELRRISAKDGLVAVTVMSELALFLKYSVFIQTSITIKI